MMHDRVKARSSTDAIERLYITMRHLFYRGSYRPSGNLGKSLENLLLRLNPEIYGSMGDPDRVELDGLSYVLDRLPDGITECSYVYLTGNEGYRKGKFAPIIPKKRRRLCYRIEQDQMNIYISRGRSEIYDILTHLTFLYHESEKIYRRAFSKSTRKMGREWQKIEKLALSEKPIEKSEREIALLHLSTILGRTYEQTLKIYKHFSEEGNEDKFFKIVYGMGLTAQRDVTGNQKRDIVFTSTLMETIGHHSTGELWTNNIKKVLKQNDLIEKPLHIISANMHSVMNMLYAHKALGVKHQSKINFDLYHQLSDEKNKIKRKEVHDHAMQKGMTYIKDESGANIDVQVFDLGQIDLNETIFESNQYQGDEVLLVFDYAFGEQAFEVMDELLKPFKYRNKEYLLNVKSISVMGKAGILNGDKGDIMIPTSHVFEGTADNYPFENTLSPEDFDAKELKIFTGSMVTVLGTSLQNKEILKYFKDSTWQSIGLEMEGAHYQKAIQIASKIRKHINPEVKVNYAYYASDNPLKTGSTLASGGLGLTGVKPTYLITKVILDKILI